MVVLKGCWRGVCLRLSIKHSSQHSVKDRDRGGALVQTLDALWTMGAMSDEIAHTLGSLHCRFHSSRVSSERTDKVISLTSKSEPRRYKHVSKLAPKLTHSSIAFNWGKEYKHSAWVSCGHPIQIRPSAFPQTYTSIWEPTVIERGTNPV